MRLPKSLGVIALSIWLILSGLAGFVNLGNLGQLLDVLAIAAGVLLLMKR